MARKSTVDSAPTVEINATPAVTFDGIEVYAASAFAPAPKPIDPHIKAFILKLAEVGKLTIVTEGWSDDKAATFAKQINAGRHLVDGRGMKMTVGTVEGKRAMQVELRAPRKPRTPKPASA